ncbi:hypothetical protein JVT61DRAFT_1658 [Boletus reticuloceps]|uniref:Uncharacterized protein n=1 Tax=Boletus reticuloceps TaxID=495285 RepID=A0A8I2YTH2_9AGAM|nr:hypothetical protein JVT61DRAFT_1658 [Boletus reticuloceps]
MSNQADFRLPGHQLNQLVECKLLLSFLAAYSWQWNSHKLEIPWYELTPTICSGTPGFPHLLSMEDE